MWYGSYMTYLDRIDTWIADLDAETYRVGGSVRDEILGRRCKDADFVVRGVDLADLRVKLRGLRPDSISTLKLRDGRQVGWRVNKKGMGLIEIALPRTEVSTGTGRHDFEIVVDPALPLFEDAKRRDFTFNALYKLIPDGPVTDPTGRGLYDLQRKLIHTTHETSFSDDPLRTLRALRFVSTLGYELSSETRKQMEARAADVTGLTQKGVSGTAFDELCKILMGDNVAEALRLGRDTGVLAVLLPELAPMLGFDQSSRYHDLTTDEHTFKALETAAHVEAPLRVRMALLFHDAGKPEAAWVGPDGRKHYYASHEFHTQDHEVVSERLWREAAARLNVPKKLRDEVASIVLNHMVGTSTRSPEVKVRRMRVQFGDDLLRDLFLHRTCDLSGKGVKVAMNHIGHIAKLERIRQEAEASGVPASVKELQVTGFDAQAAGITGQDIGEALRALLDEVVCDPSTKKLDREWQLSRLRRNHD